MSSRLYAPWIALAAAAYTLGVERFLFEWDPARFGWLGRPGPGFALAAGLAGLAGALAWTRFGRGAGDLAPPDPCERFLSASLPLFLPLVAVFSPGTDLLRTQTLLLGGAAGFAFLWARDPRPATSVGGVEASAGDSPPPTGRRIVSVTLRGQGLGRWAPPALVAAAVLGLYLRTLAPSVGEADTFEFQVAVARLAVAHPTGYPLFILLGKLFSWLPVAGTLAYRVNLASAAFGTLAAVLGYGLARRLGACPSVATVTGLLVGVSPTLWSRAVEAEVYSLHAAIVALCLLWCLFLIRIGADRSRWWNRPSTLIPLVGLTFGLGLSNHLTTILLAPAIGLALTVFVLRTGLGPLGAAGWRPWLLALTGLSLGLGVYLYIPLRWPAINHGEVMTLGMFRDYITGREPQGALHLTAFLNDPSRYAILGRKALAEFGPAGTLLAAVGLIELLRREAAAAIVMLAAYLGLSFFPLSFYVPDPDFSAFLIAPHLIEAVWIGLGVVALIDLARLPVPAMQSAFLLLPLSLIWTGLPAVDKSAEWGMYRLGQLIMAQPLAQNAMVLADSQKIAPLFYLQVAEGARPDLDIRVLPHEAAYREALDEGLAAGQTVYLGRYLPGLAGLLHLRSVGPLVEASPSPLTDRPSGMQGLGTTFGQSITLLGVRSNSFSAEAGQSLPLTLYWQAAAPVDGNYLVQLLLLDDAGTAVWHGPARVPAGGLNPTFAWTPGEIISDFHFVDLDPSLPPGDYRLQVGLFPPFSDSGLPHGDGDPWTDVAEVSVLPSQRDPAVSHSLRARFGEGPWLMGYDVPETVTPGARVPVTLYWLDTSTRRDVYGIELIGTETPVSSALGLDRWPAGRIVPIRYTLRAPDTGRWIDLQVRIPGELAACGWLALPAPGCGLPRILIQGEAADESAINFGDRILLSEATIETPAAGAGGIVEVAIRWRGLRQMADDYTAFVHLIGPDGLVHGQIDGWPVSGTLATSTWDPGRLVEDHYSIPVPPDAPPGDYHVEIGWYLLATLDRLPVLDPQGIPIDDRLLLSGLEIRK